MGEHHYDDEIRALDTRIGRLALLCGADLSKRDVVIGLIKGNFSVCAFPASAHLDSLKELRALLMMKYKIEASCVDAIGAAECARLISAQDDDLRRSGFPPQSLAP